MTRTRENFGPSLRAHRERQGITLHAIAASTKIKPSLLAALENNDVSKWPRGIFRRAFVRDYAAAIGLTPEPVVAEFVRLFPEDGHPAAVTPPADPGALRLVLASGARRTRSAAAMNLLSALVDVTVVLAIGVGISLALAGDRWTVAGLVALVYFPLGIACVGRSWGAWGMSRLGRQRRRAEQEQPRAASQAVPVGVRIADLMTGAWASVAIASRRYVPARMHVSDQAQEP